jgi:hypothetical protein
VEVSLITATPLGCDSVRAASIPSTARIGGESIYASRRPSRHAACLSTRVVGPDLSGKENTSRHRLEPLEAPRQPVLIRAILDAAGQVDGPSLQALQGFEHRAVVLAEEPVRNVQPVVGVDSDQVRIESRVVNFRERDPIGNHWLAELLITVRDDMGGIEQERLRQARDRATAFVRSDDGLAERSLVQPLFDCAQGVAPF